VRIRIFKIFVEPLEKLYVGMGNCFSKENSLHSEHKPATPTTNVEGSNQPSENVPTISSKQFAQELLDAQNVYRANHGSPPLVLNDELNEGAQKWAEHLAQIRTLQHTSDKSVGENLAWCSTSMSPQAAADNWYNEIKDYNFSNPGFTSGTGHFTQLVWKSSTEFGGGIAYDESGSAYIVGRYGPPGNISNPGYFSENVKRSV